MKKTPLPTLRMHCLRLASREAGVSVSEVTGYSATAVRGAIWHLKHDGLLFAAKLSHKVVRYFADKAKADAYARQHGNAGERANQAAGRKLSLPSPSRASQRAWWPKDAEPVITPDTKITVAPSPPEWSARSNTHSRWGG